MRESVEFRVNEVFASLLFNETEGKRLSDSVRKVVIDTSDERFPMIGPLDRKLKAEKGKPLFYSWAFNRDYSAAELQSAPAFRIKIRPSAVFEPCGEECGTTFNESAACPQCGAGAVQTSPLRLDLRKVPKTKDIARTIAGENIISQRLAEQLVDARLTGFELRRVRHKARYEDDSLELSEVPTGRQILLKAKEEGVQFPEWEFWVWLNRPENSKLGDQAHAEYAQYKRQSARFKGKAPPVWYQLVVKSAVDILSPTRVGIEPFDEDSEGRYRCPNRDTIGLNLLSELSVSRHQFESLHTDIVETQQYIGSWKTTGVLRPERRLVISQRFRQLLENVKAKGYSLEVAHLV